MLFRLRNSTRSLDFKTIHAEVLPQTTEIDRSSRFRSPLVDELQAREAKHENSLRNIDSGSAAGHQLPLLPEVSAHAQQAADQFWSQRGLIFSASVKCSR